MKIILSMAMAVIFSSLGAEVVMDFDFSSAGGKKSIQDRLGRFTCFSDNNTFFNEYHAVRSSYGSEFRIPAEQLTAFPKGFTIFTTFLHAPLPLAQNQIPIVVKGGLWNNIDFYYGLSNNMPVFFFGSGKQHFLGIRTIGNDYGNTWRYSDPDVTVHSRELLMFPAGKWIASAVSFDGKSLKIYRDGKLVLEKRCPAPEGLRLCRQNPIMLGSDRNEKGEPYSSSNSLIADFSIYNEVLPPETIAEYHKKKMENKLPGYVKLADCPHYYTGRLAGYDYDLSNRLPMTHRYVEEKLPGNRNVPVRKSALILDHGRYFIGVNGKPFYPIAGYPGIGWFGEQALRQSAEYVRDFAAADVNFQYVGTSNPSLIWKGDGKYDWTGLECSLKTIAGANPAVRIIAVLPCYLPEWFVRKYPEELEKYHSTRSKTSPLLTWTQTLIDSEIFLEKLQDYLRAQIAYLENSPYSENIVGYLVVGGDAGEFYWPASFTGGAGGYSSGTLRRFRVWLSKKYGSSEVLASAWDSPGTTLENAAIPTPEERFMRSPEIFLKKKAANVVDFRNYQTDVTAKTVSILLDTVYESSKGNKLVMMYGGYPILFAGKDSPHPSTRITETLMKNPKLSILMTPNDYVQRRGGDHGANINPYNGSARLNGKMLVSESDLRTHYYSINQFGRTLNESESCNVIARCFGYSLTRGGGLEYMAMAGNASYHSEPMMRQIRECAKTGEAALTADNSSIAEVAFFFDEKSLNMATNGIDHFMDDLSWGTYQNSLSMGAPSDFYLLSDINHPELPDYKLYVFINAFKVDPETENNILRKTRRNNATVLWCYAPGYLNGLETMRQLTGMNLIQENKPAFFTLTLPKEGHPLFRHSSDRYPTYHIAPSFFPDDPAVEVVAEANHRPALFLRKFKTWTSVYSLLPPSASLLNSLCHLSGVHVYTAPGDIFTANKSFLMLHTATAGDKIIQLPFKATMVDAMTGKAMESSQNRIMLPSLPAGVTKIFQLK